MNVPDKRLARAPGEGAGFFPTSEVASASLIGAAALLIALPALFLLEESSGKNLNCSKPL